MEFIFLGTGDSSGLPYIDCLTSPEGRKPCKTCLSTLTPDGKENVRRNTSAILRMDDKVGRKKTIVIDVGKTFQAAALEWFPKYGLREIDAILITHPHADAMNGLDDLRSWTLYGLIQPHIDIYLSQETFEVVKRSFPYLVSKEFATGGGDVPEFRWHIIHNLKPFEIAETGIFVTPFSVHHGFSTQPSDLGVTSAHACASPGSHSTLCSSHTGSSRQPFLSFGFKLSDRLVYISDVSHIPEESWQAILSGPRDPDVCVLDCLQLQPHASHLSFAQSISVARRIRATRTYLTGFCHTVTHAQYVAMCELIGGAAKDTARAAELESVDFSEAGVATGSSIWVRPAHDGLRVTTTTTTTGGGEVCDSTYLDIPPQGRLLRRGMMEFVAMQIMRWLAGLTHLYLNHPKSQIRRQKMVEFVTHLSGP